MTDNWQSLMDSAYSKWTDTVKGYECFLLQLDSAERQAVLLGNMNYQIGNGGVDQWIQNGYAVHAKEVLQVLELIGTPAAMEWHAKLRPFVVKFVNTDTQNRGCYSGDYLKPGYEEKYDDDDELSEYGEAEEVLTDFYYSEPFGPEFLAEVEAYFTRIIQPKVSCEAVVGVGVSTLT